MRPGRLVAGAALIVIYVALRRAVPVEPELGRDFVYFGWTEGFFWLAHFFLALPGLLLIADGLAPALGGLTTRVARVARAAARGRAGLASALVYGFALFVVALVGRHLLLLDLPITNDEYGVEFAAHIVAEGRLMAPVPEPRGAYPLYYTFERDGEITSFDFPGAILFHAALLRLGIGSWAWALVAALGGVLFAGAGGRLAGPRGAVVAAVLWPASPMVLALSYTSHAFLLARTAVALALFGYLVLLFGDRRWLAAVAAVCGLGAGLALLCRPFSAAALLAPVAVHLIWRALRRTPGAGRALGVTVLAFLPAVVTFALYNHGTSGVWYLPLRLVPGVIEIPAPLPHLGEWLGTNLGWNLLMLAVYLFGPLGLTLVYAGARRAETNATAAPDPGEDGRGATTAAVARVLVAGVVLALGLDLLHDNTGQHLVGPVHHSDAAVPLLLLVLLGLERLRAMTTRPGGLSVRPALPALLLVAYLVGLLWFSAVHARILRDQATINHAPLAAVAELDHAVVLAEAPAILWSMRPELFAVGSWIARLPSPDPFLRDDVIFARADADLAALRRRFPDRVFYRMSYHREGEPIRLQRLTAAAP